MWQIASLGIMAIEIAFVNWILRILIPVAPA